MATIESTTDLDKQLKNFIDVVVTLRGRMPGIPVSIEIPHGQDSPYLIFTQTEIGPTHAAYLQELCDYHGLNYHVSPLDGRLAITLTLT